MHIFKVKVQFSGIIRMVADILVLHCLLFKPDHCTYGMDSRLAGYTHPPHHSHQSSGCVSVGMSRAFHLRGQWSIVQRVQRSLNQLSGPQTMRRVDLGDGSGNTEAT